MKKFSEKLVNSSRFEYLIMTVIILNCLLIGVETYYTNKIIHAFQLSSIYIFAFEVIVRFIASKSIKDYFSQPWNIFDFSIVLISFIPESMFHDAAMVTAIRVLRVFRVLRLLRISEEIKLIISVLIKSFSSLIYNTLFFFIFMYLFAIMGFYLFKLPTEEHASPQMIQLVEEYKQIAPNAPSVAPDPYGTLGESMFTLFRILTGEDWTDLRYNLMVARKMGIIHASETVINIYHILWFVLSAFLLLNLVLGAIINNYQIIMDEQKKKKESLEKNK
jgi:voltage-gated sodium channel